MTTLRTQDAQTLVKPIVVGLVFQERSVLRFVEMVRRWALRSVITGASPPWDVVTPVRNNMDGIVMKTTSVRQGVETVK